MKNLRAVSLILVLLFLTLSFPNFSVVQGETENVSYLLKSKVRYTNLSQDNVWNFTEEDDRTISLFMNNTWQTVELVNSTFPVEAKSTDEDGNPVAVLQFPSSALQPGENVSFTVWYRIVSKPRSIPNISESESQSLSDIQPNLVNEYTGEEGSWQTSDPTLRELALSLKGSATKVLTVIKSFVAWIKDNISYPSPQAKHENPYYPNETYARREGDCDDQAILLGTLCRIVGIPSYLQVGCIYRPSFFESASVWNGYVSFVELRVAWHGWAFVYVPPWGWLPVDLTFAPGILDDPLNAVKHGAVTLQNTSQYMNVVHTDYVASSLESKEFLVGNGFRVYMEDEMMQEVEQDATPSTPSNPSEPSPTVTSIDPWVAIALTVLTAGAVFASVLIFRRWRKGRLEPTKVS